jgi:hypothetical protein
MRLAEFGETNRLSYQSLNVGPESEAFPFDLLGIRLADRVLFGWQAASRDIRPAFLPVGTMALTRSPVAKPEHPFLTSGMGGTCI